MSELIDRERFSADMRDFQNRVGIWRDEAEDTETRTRADAALATIIETKLILDKQPTIAAPRWHSVEEELPDLLQFVVVCNDDGKCVVEQYVGYQTDSLTPWRIAYTMYDTDIYDEQECGPVCYWMPIEPPKEDE